MSLFLDQNNIFYHGTRVEFETFRPLSHFGSYPAVQECAEAPGHKGEVLDIEADYPILIPYEIRIVGMEKIIPVKLNLGATYELHDFCGASDITYFRSEFLYHIVHDLKMTQIPQFYDYIFNEPFQMRSTDVLAELATDNLYKDATGDTWMPPDETNRYHLYQQRMIQYFEHLGYDGFNYTNRSEDRGHTSYVVFRPENIVRMDMAPHQIKKRNPLKIVHDYNNTPCREIEGFEQKLLSKTECFHNASNNLKRYIWTDIDLRSRPSVIKSAIRAREYYTNLLFTEILPKIENIGTQSKYGYHGLYTHTAQVAQFAIELAISMSTDPLPVLLGAALHDIARTHDDDDYTHGPRGAEIARDFLDKNYPQLFPGMIDKIVYAIANHTQKEPQPAPDLISAGVWDADRIRLSWEMKYDAKYFNTEYGKYLASLPYHTENKQPAGLWRKILHPTPKPQSLSQEKYFENQNKFLQRHNIKTH